MVQKKLQDIAVASLSAETGSVNWGKRLKHARKWLPIAVLAALMLLAYLQGWFEHLNLSTLIREKQELTEFVHGNLGTALLAFFCLYAVSVALSFPGASLLTIAGGFLFGWIVGGATAVVGATAGAIAVFLVARSSFGELLTRKAGPLARRLSEGFRGDAFNYLLFLRLTPVFPFWLVNIAPAVFNMPLASYASATLIGIIPGTFAFAFIGSGLDSIIVAQEAASPGCAAAGTCEIDFASLITPQVFVAFVALGIASLIPVALKRFRARRP